MSVAMSFDTQIERELGRILGPIDSAPVPAWSAMSSGGNMKRVIGGAGAAIGAKLVMGFAVAALAATGAGAATEVAVTGSLNPMDWGQQVKQQVAACKAALASGQHGIGECVSDFAKQHGEAVSDQHEASGARENHGAGQDKGKGDQNGQGQNGHGGGNDQSGDKGHGKSGAPGQNK
jgi:hypothetical protein